MHKTFGRPLCILSEITFTIFFVLMNISLYLLSLLPLPLRRNLLMYCGKLAMWFCSTFFGITFDKPPTPPNALIMSTHTCILETGILFGYYHPVTFIKSETLIFPFFGGLVYHSSRTVCVNRSSLQFREMINKARHCSQNKYPILLFHEGTRTNKHTPTKSKALAFIAAQEFSDRPIIPFLHTCELFTHKWRFQLIRSGHIKVRTLPPIQLNNRKGRDFLAFLDNLFDQAKKDLF